MKKFTALMLVLMMIATGLAAIFTASAEDVVTVVEREIPAEAKKWYDDNPAASEFTISNAAELAYLSVLTNQNTPETFSNKTVKLANDIVWNDGTPTSGGFIPAASQNNTIYKWTPISQKNADYSEFRGTFDGQGHIILGLYIDHIQDLYGVGFIGRGRGCTIQNVSFVNSYVEVTDNNNKNNGGEDGTGLQTSRVAIALGCYYGDVKISNVHTNGHVRAFAGAYVNLHSAVGGVVGGSGYHTAKLDISNCTASGVIGGRNAVGGIVGEVLAWIDQNAYDTTLKPSLTMDNCINYAAVSGEAEVAGLVGRLAGSANISNCTSLGETKATHYGFWSASLIGMRLNNHGGQLTVPTLDQNCRRVLLTDCYYVMDKNLTCTSEENKTYEYNSMPIYVHTTEMGAYIVIENNRYNVAASTHRLLVGNENMLNHNAEHIASDILTLFDNHKLGLLIPESGTDVVAVEGVQTGAEVVNTKFKARFVASIDFGMQSKAEIEEVGFEVATYDDFLDNGASIVQRKACTRVYKAIYSNYGSEMVKAEDFDGADYLATLTVTNIPSSQMHTLFVRSYFRTVSGETCYGGFMVFSFLNGGYAGGASVATNAESNLETRDIGNGDWSNLTDFFNS